MKAFESWCVAGWRFLLVLPCALVLLSGCQSAPRGAGGQSDVQRLAKAAEILEMAKDAAALIADRSEYVRLLAAVGEAQAKAGRTEDARGTFAEAVYAAGDIPGLGLSLVDVTRAQAQVGLFGDALSTARLIERVEFGALDDQSPAEVKGFAGIVAAGLVDWSLQEIASAQAKAGRFAEAFSTARQIEDANERAEALKEIARAQAKAGRFAEAFSTARQIADADKRAEALREIARAQARAGRFAEAFSTARQIEDADERALAFGWIALAQADAGLFADAFSTKRQIEKEFGEADVLLWGIASAQAKAGQFGDAISTARQTSWQAFALRDIASVQAEAGRFADAVATARQIEGAGLRAAALRAIALAQAKASRVEDARLTFADALSTAWQIEEASLCALALEGIASDQARAGQVEQALALAEEIRKVAGQAAYVNALVAIAKALIGEEDTPDEE